MEVDFLYYMNLLAVTTFAFIAYRLLVIEKKGKTKDHYSKPGKIFFISVLIFKLPVDIDLDHLSLLYHGQI